MFTGTSLVGAELLLTQICKAYFGKEEKKAKYTNKYTILKSDGILKRYETYLAHPRDKFTMMNVAIKKMTCLKCQTVASVFGIKMDSMRTLDNFFSFFFNPQLNVLARKV